MTPIQSKTSIVLAYGEPTGFKNEMNKLVRRLTRFAWQEFLQDVSQVELRYGRYTDGRPKKWKEWQGVRKHLKEAGLITKTKGKGGNR